MMCLKVMGLVAAAFTVAMLIMNAKEIKRYIEIEMMQPMCLSVPARVVQVHDRSWATVDVGGTTKRVSIDLIDGVEAEDWVLLHVGFALQKIDEAEAAETLALFEQLAAGEAPAPEGWAELLSP